EMQNVLISDGCCINKATIDHCVIGIRSQIQQGTLLKDTVLMGMDYYEPRAGRPPTNVPLGIGRNCHIEGALIDKNPRIGENVVIKPFPLGTEMDRNDWYVRDGIVVIPKSTEIPAGTVIQPE
ncbi:MAG: glucose-1-phosphate adenylyltransferase, partial [Gammaproteobacteria bacterium]|nr:glucose-1-phosphate adenylyltransferase [Gammaproteobacteria bacterium]